MRYYCIKETACEAPHSDLIDSFFLFSGHLRLMLISVIVISVVRKLFRKFHTYFTGKVEYLTLTVARCYFQGMFILNSSLTSNFIFVVIL